MMIIVSVYIVRTLALKFVDREVGWLDPSSIR